MKINVREAIGREKRKVNKETYEKEVEQADIFTYVGVTIQTEGRERSENNEKPSNLYEYIMNILSITFIEKRSNEVK